MHPHSPWPPPCGCRPAIRRQPLVHPCGRHKHAGHARPRHLLGSGRREIDRRSKPDGKNLLKREKTKKYALQMADVPAVLASLGFMETTSFLTGYTKFERGDLAVEFLMPLRGDGREQVVTVKPLKITTQGVRYPDYQDDELVPMRLRRLLGPCSTARALRVVQVHRACGAEEPGEGPGYGATAIGLPAEERGGTAGPSVGLLPVDQKAAEDAARHREGQGSAPPSASDRSVRSSRAGGMPPGETLRGAEPARSRAVTG